MPEKYISSHTGETIDNNIQNLIDYGTLHEGTLIPECIPLDGQQSSTAPTYTTSYNWIKYRVLANTCFVTFHLKINVTNAGSGYAILAGMPYRSAYDTCFALYEMCGLKNHNSGDFIPTAAITIQSGANHLRLENDNGLTATTWGTGDIWIGGTGFYFIQS